MNWTGFAIWISMALLLGSLGQHWDSWQFYGGLGLLWAMKTNTELEFIMEMKAAYEQLLKDEEKNDIN